MSTERLDPIEPGTFQAYLFFVGCSGDTVIHIPDKLASKRFLHGERIKIQSRMGGIVPLDIQKDPALDPARPQVERAGLCWNRKEYCAY